jgi:hypothetical protein
MVARLGRLHRHSHSWVRQLLNRRCLAVSTHRQPRERDLCQEKAPPVKAGLSAERGGSQLGITGSIR